MNQLHQEKLPVSVVWCDWQFDVFSHVVHPVRNHLTIRFIHNSGALHSWIDFCLVPHWILHGPENQKIMRNINLVLLWRYILSVPTSTLQFRFLLPMSHSDFRDEGPFTWAAATEFLLHQCIRNERIQKESSERANDPTCNRRHSSEKYLGIYLHLALCLLRRIGYFQQILTGMVFLVDLHTLCT